MKFLSFLCTKWMENCEAMTSSTHSFAYSYGLVKKCFLKICKTSNFITSLFFNRFSSGFHCSVQKILLSFSEIKLNQLWTSPLTTAYPAYAMHFLSFPVFILFSLKVHRDLAKGIMRYIRTVIIIIIISFWVSFLIWNWCCCCCRLYFIY